MNTTQNCFSDNLPIGLRPDQYNISKIDFYNINYLQTGNLIQKQTFSALQQCKIFQILASQHDFDTVLVGTIPINIDIIGSDLDIVLNCPINRQDELISILTQHFQYFEQFSVRKQLYDGETIVMAHFIVQGYLPTALEPDSSLEDPTQLNEEYRSRYQFEIEIFAQNKPTAEQNGYRHMIKEAQIIDFYSQRPFTPPQKIIGLESNAEQVIENPHLPPNTQPYCPHHDQFDDKTRVSQSDAYSTFRYEVVKLKQLFKIKTEPAFAQLLGLDGNPYQSLLDYNVPVE